MTYRQAGSNWPWVGDAGRHTHTHTGRHGSCGHGWSGQEAGQWNFEPHGNRSKSCTALSGRGPWGHGHLNDSSDVGGVDASQGTNSPSSLWGLARKGEGHRPPKIKIKSERTKPGGWGARAQNYAAWGQSIKTARTPKSMSSPRRVSNAESFFGWGCNGG